MAIKKPKFNAHFIVLRNFSSSLFANCRDKVGRITVEIAMTKTPKGNSSNRLEKYKKLTPTIGNIVAINVSNSKFTCATEDANKVGTINFITFLILESLKSGINLGIKPKRYKDGI